METVTRPRGRQDPDCRGVTEYLRNFYKRVWAPPCRVTITILLQATFMVACWWPCRAQSTRPNIILVMLDDLDISDVGAYGSSDVRTSTMDRIAKEGMRFDQYYANGPVCSPTRIAILSGQYPTRFGVHRAILNSSMRGIPSAIETLPEALRAAGYRTAHVGKWHVGTARREFLPSLAGFDHSVRLVEEAGYYGYTRFKLSLDDQREIVSDPGSHLTEVLTDHALRFMETAREAGKEPFFLNLWYFAPHDPLEVPEDFDNSETNYCLQRRTDNCHVDRGRLAALVTNADEQIGRILNYLADTGLDSNTLVIVTSDNGGAWRTHSPAAAPARLLRGYKEHLFEGGIRVPLLIRWPGVVQPAAVDSAMILSFDLYPTIVEAAGQDATNYELDGSSFLKRLTRESDQGEIRTVFWENKASNTAIHSSNGLYNTYAVRKGDWKLVFEPDLDRRFHGGPELFDLANDPMESQPLLSGGAPGGASHRLLGVTVTKLSAREVSRTGDVYANVVATLQEEYFAWRRETGMLSLGFEQSESGVEEEDDSFLFNGGLVTAAGDTRIVVSDYDLTFLTQIETRSLANRGTIAEVPGSWNLFLDADTLVLEVSGIRSSRSNETTVRMTSEIDRRVPHTVGFTIYGWRDGPSEIRLFVDGRAAALLRGEASLDRVSPPALEGETAIYIGNNSSLSSPFFGRIARPRVSVLSLYPVEMMWMHAFDLGQSNAPTASDSGSDLGETLTLKIGYDTFLKYVILAVLVVAIGTMLVVGTVRLRRHTP